MNGTKIEEPIGAVKCAVPEAGAPVAASAGPKVFENIPAAGRRVPNDPKGHVKAQAEAAKGTAGNLKHGPRVGSNHPGHKGAVEKVRAAIASDTTLEEHQRAFLLQEIELLSAEAVQVSFHPSQGKDDRFGSWHVKRLF